MPSREVGEKLEWSKAKRRPTPIGGAKQEPDRGWSLEVQSSGQGRKPVQHVEERSPRGQSGGVCDETRAEEHDVTDDLTPTGASTWCSGTVTRGGGERRV